MKYPNYKYYDSAVGGWHNRNNVVYNLKDTQGKTDTGRTYFRFNEDYRDYWESNKSVKDYSGPCFADYIPIDIDRDSIPEAIETVQNFIAKVFFDHHHKLVQQVQRNLFTADK